ncbi:hypothetical protein HY640_00475 [Candidatus Woesearchaeota archaeon]|nr:hypothetical protein [Candidatus Woesearchaeota archaeon]
MSDLDERVFSICRDRGLDELAEVYRRLPTELPRHVDAVHLVANTRDNEASLFERAQELYVRGFSERFLIVGGVEANGFPGYDNWSAVLSSYISSDVIYPVPIDRRDKVNTHSESVALMRYAREQGFSSVCMVAAPFHLLRAFYTAVSVMLDAEKGYPGLVFYACAGTHLDWGAEALHSQGTVRATRSALLGREIANIKAYQVNSAPPPLAPERAVLDYISSRSLWV